jgi:hypothetical protein
MKLVSVRYPPPANCDEGPESWQDAEPNIILLDDHLSPDAVKERFAQLDRMAAQGTFQPTPRAEPVAHGWLSTLLWPIAALCAVGLVVAGIG